MTTSQPTSSQPNTTTEPVRATWKQHGMPTSGFEFFGTEVKTPAAKGKAVGKVATDKQGVHLKAANGRAIMGGDFAAATKFWAVVPADAPRMAAEVREPKAKAEALPPVVITAAKGGDQTVAPKKGAIAKAITATGKSIMAISREHGLNPSQMRRLSLDTVAKVDLARAIVIADALGAKMGELFGEPTAKAGAKPATPPATTGPKTSGSKSKSKATKAAEKLAADHENLTAQAEAAQAAEAKAAQDAAEGTQAERDDQLASELGRIDTLDPTTTPAAE
jgi:hypothetical protein